MKRRIGTIKISGLDVPVYTDNLSDEKLDGWYDRYASPPAIYIDETTRPQRRAEILLHETIHALSSHHGLGITERQTRALSLGLFALGARIKLGK